MAAAGVAPNRDHVPVPPHRHRRIGRRGAGLEPAKQRVQPPEQTLAGGLHLSPSGGKTRTGRVQQVAVGVDRLLEPALDGPGRAAVAPAPRRSGSRARPPGADRRAPPGRGRASRCRAASSTPSSTLPSIRSRAERAGHVGDRLRQEPIAPAEQPAHLSRPAPAPHGSTPGHRWAGGLAPARRRAGRPRGGDQLEHRAELDGLECIGGLLRRQRQRGAALHLGRHPVGRE